MQAIQTRYGVISGRDALVLSRHELSFSPFSLRIKASLSLAACEPEIVGVPDVNIEFYFYDIEKLSVYKVDDFPYEKYSESSFDLIEEPVSGRKRIALSTYDYVFDITGKFDIIYS